MAEAAVKEEKKEVKKAAPKPKAAVKGKDGAREIPAGVDTSKWAEKGFKSETAYKWYLHKFAT